MKYKYKGNVPIHVWDKENSFSVCPGDIVELSFAPNKNFIEMIEDSEKTEKKIKKIREEN